MPTTEIDEWEAFPVAEEKDDSFGAFAPAPQQGYEFANNSPYIANMMADPKLDDETKSALQSEFQRGWDSWDENERPSLTQRAIETAKDSWLGIEGVPTLAGALFTEAERGTAESNLSTGELKRLNSMRREIQVRSGELDNAFENPTWASMPTEFLMKEIEKLEAEVPKLEVASESARLMGMMEQAYRAGRFAALPEWQNWREGVANLGGYLAGGVATPESMIPVPGSPAGTPIIKAVASRFGRAALVSGAATTAVEPIIQESAAKNYVQEPGFDLAGGVLRTVINMTADGVFNVSGDLFGRVWRRFRVNPDELNGKSLDEVVDIISHKNEMSRQEVMEDLAGVYDEYANDVAATVADTAVETGEGATDVIADSTTKRALTKAEADVLPVVQARGASPNDLIKEAFTKLKGSERGFGQDAIYAQLEQDLVDMGVEITPEIAKHIRGTRSQNHVVRLGSIKNEIDIRTIQGEAVTPEDAIPEGMKRRKFIQTVKDSPQTHPETRDLVESVYASINNPDTLATAQARIDSIGVDESMRVINETPEPTAETVAMGVDLIRRFQNEKDYARAADVANMISEKSTSQGQAIQALSIYNRLTPEGVLILAQRKLNALQRQYPNKKNLPDKLTDEQMEHLIKMANRVQDAKLPREKIVRAAQLDMELNSMVRPPNLAAKIRTARVIGMLANAKTIIRNVGGNQFLFAANFAGDYLDVPVDIGVSYLRAPFVKGAKAVDLRTKTIPSAKAKALGFLEPFKEIAEGYRVSYPDVVEDGFYGTMKARTTAVKGALDYAATLGKLTSQNKFELNTVRNLNQWVFDSKLGRRIEKTLALTLGVPDRAFWWSAVRNSLDQQMKIARIQGREVVSPSPKMVQQAYMDGMKAIYQDPNFIARNVQGVRNAMNMGMQFGLGDVVLPFAQVPATILVRGLDYTPAGYIRNLYEGVGPLFGRKFDQKAFVEAFTKATAGTFGIVQTGYWLSERGIITASLDEDKDIRDYQRGMGMGAYRLNYSALKRMLVSGDFNSEDKGQDGDVILSYDWAQPLSIPLAMGAELRQVEQNEHIQGKTSVLDTTSNYLMAMKSGMLTIKELSFLQSINSFLESLVYNELDPLEVGKDTLLKDLPASFVPTILNQFNQVQDNTIRDIRGPDEFENSYLKVANRIPGVVEAMGFPANRDLWGEVVRRYPNVEQQTFLNVFANPALMSTLRKDPMGEKIVDLYEATGEKGVFPRRSPYKVKINGEDKVLTPTERSLYQQWVGRLTRDMFHSMMQSPAYAEMPEVDKARQLANVITAVAQAGRIEILGEEITKDNASQMVMTLLAIGKIKSAQGRIFDEEEPED